MKRLLFVALATLSFAANASFYERVTTATLDDDPDSVATSQSAAGAESLTIDGALASGGVATLPEAQPIRITSAADDSGVVFTITGTDADGNTVNEDVTGANASTADSTNFFKTVTGVATDGATAGNVTVGTESDLGMVTKSYEFIDWNQAGFRATLSAELTSGTGTFGMQYTVDPSDAVWTDSYSWDANWQDAVDGTDGLDPDSNTATGDVQLTAPVRAVRGKVTTGGGTYTFTIIQGDNKQ